MFPVVEGRLQDPSGVGISGAQVSAAAYPCPSPPVTPSSITSCTIVATGITDADGAFALTLSQVGAAYYLVANRTPTTGGTGLWFRASTELTVLPTMTAPAYVPYGNATIFLPGYANLTRYYTSENLNVQVPILSWTADGAFYVNTALELVFYDFASGAVRPIAPWLPLYENVMNYAGVENTEWATTDGAFIYEFGCLSLCVNVSRITFYGVNVTTGAAYEWNYTGIVDDSTRLNAEVTVVGKDGASTDAVLILSNGVMVDWNLANGTQWILGILPFFEANNIYWVSFLNAWFDVAADNSTRDEIEEIGFTGSSITIEAAGYWGANVGSNFVGGMDYNLTDHRLYFTAGTCRTNRVVTAYASIGDGGVMDGVTSLGLSGCGFGHPLPQTPGGEPTGSSEHRIGLAASGPWVAGAWNSTFQNGSWLLDPSTGAWSTSNVSQSWGIASANESYQPSYDEEGLFYNGTYLIGLPSASCAQHAPCSIDGRSSRGEIAWNWKLGGPEFPFPASAPLAETAPPPAPVLVNASVNRTIVTLAWTENATPSASILNETVYYSTTDPVGGPNGSVSLPGTARSVVLTQLEPRSCYRLEVVSLNLHWTSAPLQHSLCTGPSAPRAPVLVQRDVPLRFRDPPDLDEPERSPGQRHDLRGSRLCRDGRSLARSPFQFLRVHRAFGRHGAVLQDPGLGGHGAIEHLPSVAHEHPSGAADRPVRRLRTQFLARTRLDQSSRDDHQRHRPLRADLPGALRPSDRRTDRPMDAHRPRAGPALLPRRRSLVALWAERHVGLGERHYFPGSSEWGARGPGGGLFDPCTMDGRHFRPRRLRRSVGRDLFRLRGRMDRPGKLLDDRRPRGGHYVLRRCGRPRRGRSGADVAGRRGHHAPGAAHQSRAGRGRRRRVRSRVDRSSR